MKHGEKYLVKSNMRFRVSFFCIIIFSLLFSTTAFGLSINDSENSTKKINFIKLDGLNTFETQPSEEHKKGITLRNIETYLGILDDDMDKIWIDFEGANVLNLLDYKGNWVEGGGQNIVIGSTIEEKSFRFSEEYMNIPHTEFNILHNLAIKGEINLKQFLGDTLPDDLNPNLPTIMMVCVNYDDKEWEEPRLEEPEEHVELVSPNTRVIIIQKPGFVEEVVDKKDLQEAILKAQDIIENHANEYHQVGDRYNKYGEKEYIPIDERLSDTAQIEKAKQGYWYKLNEAYEEAKKEYAKTKTSQVNINERKDALVKALKLILPKSEINATSLADVCYYLPKYHQFLKAKGKATELSLLEYETNLARAHDILGGLYNEDGSPTEKNWGVAKTGNMPHGAYTQKMVDKFAKMLGKDEKGYYPFFDKEGEGGYEACKNKYYAMLPELLATMEKYAPSRLNSEDYTQGSWDAYVEAYDKLAAHLEINKDEFPIISKKKLDGGSIRDKDFFQKLFYKFSDEAPADYLKKFRSAKENLTSAVPIDIELEYVSNYFTAKGKGFNQYRARDKSDASTEIYEKSIHLEAGSTNLYSVLKNSGIIYDLRTQNSAGSTNTHGTPTCLVYLNGEYIGTKELGANEVHGFEYREDLKNVQLHQGDKLKLIRVLLTEHSYEISTGYDTTGIKTYPLNIGDYAYPYVEKSVAKISASKQTAPAKVGDKLTFNVDVKGALLSNKDRSFGKDGIVLFMSEPSQEKKLSRIEYMTTAKTDETGKLEYVFGEPGYYTVAFFNMKNDECFFEDVYRNVNPGKYYSLQAGDYQIIKIDPVAEDEEKRIFEKYKAEKLREAEEYFNDIHEYDFRAANPYKEIQGLYNALVLALSEATNLKEILSSYEILMNEIEVRATDPGSTYDHKDIIAKLRAQLDKLPADLSEANYRHTEIIMSIQKIEKKLNDYQRSLLSEMEQERIKEAIAKLADGSLNNIPNAVRVSSSSENVKLAYDVGWSPEAGNFNKVFKAGKSVPEFYSWSNKTHVDGTPNDGTVKEPVFQRQKDGITETASMKPGDRLLMRRYCDTSTDAYGLVYSINGNAFKPADRVEFNPNNPGDSKKMFYIDYTMPDDFTGAAINIVLKQISEAEYGELQLSSEPTAKEAAKATIDAEFAKYVKGKYSEDNWKLIEKAKNDGLQAIESASSLDAVTIAKNTAIMEMAKVKTIKQASEPGTENGGVSAVPLPDFGPEVGKVHVIVENQTFKDSDAAWHGRLIDGWYDLERDDTMMTSILKALQLKGCHWSTGSQGNASSWDDYGISYLASIKLADATKGDGSDFVVNDRSKRLGEFSGDRGSGWMGTLNDWFTNEGFNAFGVRNKKLEDGDEIHVQFTQNLGVDLGGTWGNSDTRIKTLDVRGKGSLSPSFSPDVKEYMYLIPSGGNDALSIVPGAMNKNYLVKTFLNRYNSDSAYFKKSRTIPVKKGDVIYIGCGDDSWPSMNKQGAEARAYTGSIYTIRVVDGVETFVKEGIEALPSVNRISLSNYTKYEGAVQAVKERYDAMSKEEKAKISEAEASKLNSVFERVKFFAEIDKVKKALAALPNAAKSKDDAVRSIKSDIENADSLYKALTDEQKRYITIADAANYNKLVERLGKLKVKTSAKTISGSEQAPVSPVVEPKAEVVGDKAIVKLEAEAVKEVIKEAAKSGEKKIIIEPTGTKDAKEISVSIPKAAAEAIAEKKDMEVSVETKSGQVNIPAAAMESIVKEAKGADISIDIALKEKEEVKDAAAWSLMKNKDAVAVEVKISSAGKNITKFASPIEILLPVNEKFAEGKNYPVTQISADGSKANPVGKCVKIGGKLYIKVSVDHLSIFVVSPEAVADTAFSDITGHWAYDAIKYAVDNKLMNGVSEDKFNPNGTLSRAMLATILYRIEKEPKVAEAAKYKDVQAGQWYSDAIAWASKEGIVTGYSGDTFAPNDNITREQMAAMLMRYSKYKKQDVSKSKELSVYKDMGEISPWAMDAMKWAGAEGLVNGRTADTIVPKGTATRAEAATILKRYLERK